MLFFEHILILIYIYLGQSVNITTLIKPRSMTWAGHIARIEPKKDLCKLFEGKLEGK
jgi:hypothetical protein